MNRIRLRAAGRRRVFALRRMALPILQTGIAAGVAWYVAREVLQHSRPFFAPIAVIICIGVGMGQQRLRRAVEMVVGVSVGIGVGDLLAYSVGTGVWQIALFVSLAMTAAVVLDGGPLLTSQAASSAVLVATLIPPTGPGGVDRMVDALIGGVVGLVAVSLLPGNPAELARRSARQAVRTLTAALNAAADAIDQAEPDRAMRALREIRAQELIDDYRDALRSANEVLVISPVHLRRRRLLRVYSAAVEPLDHALRNCRVLLRRIRGALADGEPIPTIIPVALRRLAEAVGPLIDQLEHDPTPVRAALSGAAASIDAASIADSGFSANVIVAQFRSVAVDLLQATGLSHDDARAVLPPIS